MEDYSSDGSCSFYASQMPNEFEFPNQIFTMDEWILFTDGLMGWGDPLLNHRVIEKENEKIEGSATDGGLTYSETSQYQLNHVETSEASYQTESGHGKRKLTSPQRKENKKRSDQKYREKLKKIEADKTEEIERLKKENEDLIAKNIKLKELIEQRPVQAPQRECTCITRSTSKQLDHPSDSVQEIVYVTENQENSQSADNDNTPRTELLAKIDADEESSVKISDFTGLDGTLEQVGRYSFPLSLVSTVKRIIDIHGDISVTSKINPNSVGTIYFLFCASVKEMDEIQLEQLTEDRILKWRDAIKDALRVNFKVDFAMEHLKKIAHAYIGRIESQELQNVTEMISKLEAELNTRKEELARIKEMSKKFTDAAEEFNGKSLSLFT